MNDTTNTDQPENTNDQGAQQPPFMILHQFVKDISFENPKGRHVGLSGGFDEQTNINLRVDVSAEHIENSDFEVSLHVNVENKAGEDVVFLAEMVYGTLVRVGNIPQETLHPLLLVEIPRLVFPFARNIIANATRDGGYDPLLIQPIDFADLFRRKVAAAQAQADAEGQGEAEA